MGQKQDQLVFVFDLDNTLVMTNQANNMAYQEAIKRVLGKDIRMNNQRFTREDLFPMFPHFSYEQIDKIVKQKEDVYSGFLQETILNTELFKILKLTKTNGHKNILLTESHKARAIQVCSYHLLTPFFSKLYYKEDYGTENKYLFLNKHFTSISSVILFENEKEEILKAKQYGIPENQILTIKF